MTSYVVLRRGEDEDAWTPLSKEYSASSAASAAKAAALAVEIPGEYVAVPARSWDPIKLEIVTNPRVKVVK